MVESGVVEMLGIVLEASSELEVSACSVEFERVVEAMLILCKAHLMCNRHGELVCLAALPGTTQYLYSSSAGVPFSETDLVGKLRSCIASSRDEPVATAAAIGRFLCTSNKRSVSDSRTSSRVLVLKLGIDEPSQYNATMNCIFSAQRQNVMIDACVLANRASVVMKQAAHLTSGVFLHVSRRSGFEDLPVHLISAFAAPPSSRHKLSLPLVEETDFRTVCRHHDHSVAKVLDRAWVCSVCLSTYCDEHRFCFCTSDDPMLQVTS